MLLNDKQYIKIFLRMHNNVGRLPAQTKIIMAVYIHFICYINSLFEYFTKLAKYHNNLLEIIVFVLTICLLLKSKYEKQRG